MVLDVFRIRKRFKGEFDPEPVRINDFIDVDELYGLDTNFCYNCILQHPENHIVYSRSPFNAFLKIVAIYDTFAVPPLVDCESQVRYNVCVRECVTPYSKEYVTFEIPDEHGDEAIYSAALKVFVDHSIFVDYGNGAEAYINQIEMKREQYAAFMSAVDCDVRVFSSDIFEGDDSMYYPPSWIFTNTRTGHRTEVANPFYEFAKSLRYMQPNMLYQYLVLRNVGSTHSYLSAFPMYRNHFDKFEIRIQNYITEVHNAYVNFYIKKQREPLIPKKYFVIAAKIHHEIYLKQSFSERRKITRQTVSDYFDGMTHGKAFYYLNSTESL
jgi:hypothetical protein